MAVLADITRSITAALDLDILLQRIVEGARDLCASDTAAIFLRDGDSEAMVPRCRVGPWLEQYRALRIHPGQGLGGEVIVGGKPARTTHYLGDPRMPEDFRPIARETGTIALLVVPIAIGSRVEGLLNIANREARSFTDVDEAISLRLADQAAIALRNAELLGRARMARQEAEAANRAKDEFLAVLSHELRTPLTSVLGWTRMLRTGTLGEARASRALETIERNARLQAQLIDELLDVSRIITGKLRIERHTVDLVLVIEATVDAIRLEAEQKGLTLRTTLDPAAGAVWGDSARLQQVVWNLLSNAVKFTPPGGRIDVSLHRNGNEVQLVVRDTGQGIEPETLPHVFNRFRQADSSSRRSHGGLGLAIARQVVELHGGTIRAESRGKTAGLG